MKIPGHLVNLTFSELKVLAKKNGTLDALIALSFQENMETASKLLGLEEDFSKFENSKKGVSVHESIEMNNQYYHFLIDKICFP